MNDSISWGDRFVLFSFFIGLPAIIFAIVFFTKAAADPKTFELRETYELVSVNTVNQTDFSGSFSGAYLFGLGGSSGSIETTHNKIYEYWYKRPDGGIIPASIDMSTFEENSVYVVVYEDNTVSPKIEIWRNKMAQDYGDGMNGNCYTEFRFFIPYGSFVNTYDFNGTQNFEKSE